VIVDVLVVDTGQEVTVKPAEVAAAGTVTLTVRCVLRDDLRAQVVLLPCTCRVNAGRRALPGG
jgi:hypothetical protein